MARALGARVGRFTGARGRLAADRAWLPSDSRQRALVRPAAAAPRVFQWHYEAFELPPGANAAGRQRGLPAPGLCHRAAPGHAVAALEKDWAENPRWKGIKRGYTAADVVRLRGSLQIEHTLAKRGAEKLWNLINTEPFVNSLGALTGNQAMQQVKAGLKAIYLSGWQVAGDANSNGEMYPDQSLYSVDSVPKVVKRINNTFKRADQIQWSEGKNDIDYFAPIVADAEAGFGGVLNAFELMKAMIDAGAAGVHFEDQLASVKKCGHMGGKVLVPTREAVAKLTAARLAADVMGTPTILLARTDAEAADLVTSDVDDNDKPFLTGERTVEGFFRSRNGLEQAISRGLAYARVRRPDLVRDRQAGPGLRQGLRRRHPRQVPGQAAGLQLLAVVQLEEEPGRRHHRQVPARAGRHGLQVPVHHAGRLPQPELRHVRPGLRLRAQQHERLRRTAGEGIRRRRARASPR
jgi:2-methylisocitrate lyase-like PEP mutase family enzyme